ncbi:hypothetical protein WY02_17890 [Pseudonocardia sp. AL041005-10]|nr:hypothetical protein WY02_17890 [Pseudonocardia sp. AL041005-10]
MASGALLRVAGSSSARRGAGRAPPTRRVGSGPGPPGGRCRRFPVRHGSDASLRVRSGSSPRVTGPPGLLVQPGRGRAHRPSAVVADLLAATVPSGTGHPGGRHAATTR